MDFVQGTFQTVSVSPGESATFYDVVSFLCSNPYWGWDKAGRLIRQGSIKFDYRLESLKNYRTLTDGKAKIEQYPLFLSMGNGRKLAMIKIKEPDDVVIHYAAQEL